MHLCRKIIGQKIRGHFSTTFCNRRFEKWMLQHKFLLHHHLLILIRAQLSFKLLPNLCTLPVRLKHQARSSLLSSKQRPLLTRAPTHWVLWPTALLFLSHLESASQLSRSNLLWWNACKSREVNLIRPHNISLCPRWFQPLQARSQFQRDLRDLLLHLSA